jgi:hypothetical protein
VRDHGKIGSLSLVFSNGFSAIPFSLEFGVLMPVLPRLEKS